jgi:uncharacterized protein
MTTPTFRVLDADECRALLTEQQVGRLAYSHKDHVDIEPIHFVYVDGWIYGRTAPGSKLRTLAKNRWVAFEVDEIRGLFEWRSVVVHGALYLLDRHEGGAQQSAWDAAVAALRRLIPDALDADDPTPERRIVFRIHVDQLTGRAATST